MGSNQLGVFIAETPMPISGWRLGARNLSGTQISKNLPYIKLGFTVELNDVGAGEVELDFADPFFKDPVPSTFTPDFISRTEFVWEVYEGDVLRGAWLNTTTAEAQVSDDGDRRVTLKGPGVGFGLTWSMVLPPNYPSVAPPYWSFAKPRMYQWLQIWAECAKRTPDGSLQKSFIPTFTREADGSGNVWMDPNYELQQENGPNMLDLLSKHTKAIKADFYISPEGNIDVRYSKAAIDQPGKYFGIDRTQVVFWNAVLQSKKVAYDRSEIANTVVAQDSFGDISVVANTSSQTAFGIREKYVQTGTSDVVGWRNARAQEQLNWYDNQQVSWSLGVLPYQTADDGSLVDRVFVDYTIGDWIYVANPNTSAKDQLQIQAITVAVDSDTEIQVELTLESLFQIKRKKEQDAANASTGGGGGAGGESGIVFFYEEIWHFDDPAPTTFTLHYLPIEWSEQVHVGMKKYMEVDGSGNLAQREFTRFLERGVKWKREGWDVKILDTSIFDEDPT